MFRRWVVSGIGRFDAFARGVNEIGGEWGRARATNPELVIEKNLMLHYPQARYFYFARTPQGKQLAKRIDDGLRRLIKSGEFEKRYQKFKKTMLADLNLAGRRVFRLTNPLLSPETPLADASLWDSLSIELKTRP